MTPSETSPTTAGPAAAGPAAALASESLALPVETFRHDGEVVAVVVRAGARPAATAFVTDTEASLQLGFIVSPAGREIPRHVHRPPVRTLARSAEVLVVESGTCEMDLYGDDLAPVATVVLRTGDVALLLRGGHGFRMTEDTVLLEVKQGPYPGPDEKQHF